jgi:hypothetical protein
MTQVIRHFEFNLCERGLQLPPAVSIDEKPALPHVLQGDHHEKWIAVAVAVHECG